MHATSHAEQTPAKPAQRSRGWLVCAGLVLIAAAAVGFVALMPANKPPTPPVETVPVNVKTWRVRALPELVDGFDLTAIVEPEAVVEVAAEVPGRIERLARRANDVTWRGRVIRRGAVLEEGEPITAGEPIAHLNKDLLQARFDRSQTQFEYDEREYRRLQDLFERGTTSKTELDDAHTRRDVSKAMQDEAARQLERSTIVAPISGILNRLPMEVGEYASPGDPVAEIVDVDRVKVVVDVPERDVHYLKVGDTAEVFVRAAGEEEGDREKGDTSSYRPPASSPRMPASDNGTSPLFLVTGKITYISVIADPGARTTRLEITVDNRDHRLRSGQIARARLTRRVLADVIMIPLGSVIPLEHGRVVYLVDDEGHAQRRVVELGLLKGRSVRVLDGLKEGDRLIVVGHRYVGPGQPVTVVQELNEQP